MDTKVSRQFEKLKHLLVVALVLQIVDPNKEFFISIDASLEGLGGVLMQAGHVIAYESHKLKDHERNYAICCRTDCLGSATTFFGVVSGNRVFFVPGISTTLILLISADNDNIFWRCYRGQSFSVPYVSTTFHLHFSLSSGIWNLFI